jgi:hypothetical protein
MTVENLTTWMIKQKDTVGENEVAPVIIVTKCEDGVMRVAKTNNTTGVLPVEQVSSPRYNANAVYARDYSINGINSSGWSEIVTSLANAVSRLHIFDSSGFPVMLAVGAIGSEQEVFRISPGGDGLVDLLIAAGSRLSIKATSGTIYDGNLQINFLS